MRNRLGEATSPYLLQHRDNPVHWQTWGPEALSQARTENRPILLSVGYAACHWCHVMAHESFEDQATADIMNRLFVCIKVDREERPDIDAIYQQAPRKLSPRPMPPTAQMTSNPYYIEHHRHIEEQLTSAAPTSTPTSMLTAGHKKDVVLTPRLAARRGRVAIYGWHQLDGVPIQPLSTVHSAHYADYSHGIRLVWDQVRVNGESFSVAQILADPERAALLSDEGAFDPETLIQDWLTPPVD